MCGLYVHVCVYECGHVGYGIRLQSRQASGVNTYLVEAGPHASVARLHASGKMALSCLPTLLSPSLVTMGLQMPATTSDFSLHGV